MKNAILPTADNPLPPMKHFVEDYGALGADPVLMDAVEEYVRRLYCQMSRATPPSDDTGRLKI